MDGDDEMDEEAKERWRIAGGTFWEDQYVALAEEKKAELRGWSVDEIRHYIVEGERLRQALRPGS